MKIDIRIALAIIICLFLADRFLLQGEPLEPKIVTVYTPVINGAEEKKLDSVRVDTVEIKVPGKPTQITVVDSTYKADYENAIKENDSLKAKNIFLKSIAINTVNDTLVNNKNLTVLGEFTTRGKLLDYKIDYTIHPQSISYVDNPQPTYPKASFVVGVDVGLPSNNANNNAKPSVGIKGGIMGKNGSIWTVGYNTQDIITIGYSKAFKLF